jgi:hypothetical protein
MPASPQIEGQFTTVPGLSLEIIQAMTDVTVQADLANGSSYILANAWTEDADPIDSVRGQLRIRWNGVTCDEITGSNAIPT